MKKHRYYEIANLAKVVTDQVNAVNHNEWVDYRVQMTINYFQNHAILFGPHHFDEGLNVSGSTICFSGRTKIYYEPLYFQPRQNFTIVHELGHYILDKDDPSPVYDGPQPMDSESELEANIIASRLLIPDECLIKSLMSGWSFLTICKTFGISQSALSRRLEMDSMAYMRTTQRVANQGANNLKNRSRDGYRRTAADFANNLNHRMWEVNQTT